MSEGEKRKRGAEMSQRHCHFFARESERVRAISDIFRERRGLETELSI